MLSRYRMIGSRRIPKWIFGILLAWWFASLISYYQQEPDTSEAAESAYRLCEPTWAIATELEDDPLWLQYFLLFDSSEGAKASCVDYFEKLREADLLNGKGEQSLRLMKSLSSSSPEPPSDTILKRWKRESYDEGHWAWEVEAMQGHFGDNPPQWAAATIRDELRQRKTILRLWIASLAIWVAAFVVGLPFIPAALACFRTVNHQAASPITRCWHPLWILGLIFIIILSGDWFVGLAYSLVPLPVSWQGSLWESVLLDGLWRFAGPAFLASVAFASWRHGSRILKLHTPSQWKPLFGMLPIVITYDLIIWKLCEWANLTDTTSHIYFEEDGMSGLVYSIISAVIFAPIAEELVFRGFLFQSLERRSGFWPAALLSTFLFAMIHFYGFQGSLSVASFGIVACVLYRATGSLWTPIIYHALTNGIITAASWPLYNGLYSDF
ncbi:CPBP family intramembrane glutamic endopeptidase [Haloferula chungangensis]|uniref:CPBP family intramembrane glutamic endopeptidase n=1 Tax=Haloferula chungangensis TaxID=1048331 RepID=A0ABW2LD76_9BACT